MQKNGTGCSCKHLLFVLMFLLEQEEDVLNEQNIGEGDVKTRIKHCDIGKKTMKKIVVVIVNIF